MPGQLNSLPKKEVALRTRWKKLSLELQKSMILKIDIKRISQHFIFFCDPDFD